MDIPTWNPIVRQVRRPLDRLEITFRYGGVITVDADAWDEALRYHQLHPLGHPTIRFLMEDGDREKWLPIRPLAPVFRLSEEFIRRLANHKMIDSYRERPASRHMIRVSSLRDYVNRVHPLGQCRCNRCRPTNAWVRQYHIRRGEDPSAPYLPRKVILHPPQSMWDLYARKGLPQ